MNDQSQAMLWRVAEEGFWAGTFEGSFAGTVDQSGTHFYARNQFGEYLGDFADLGRAQRAVESHLVTPQLAGALQGAA